MVACEDGYREEAVPDEDGNTRFHGLPEGGCLGQIRGQNSVRVDVSPGHHIRCTAEGCTSTPL